MAFFIIDKDTKKYYRLIFQNRTHTFGEGWDKPEPSPEDHWTDNKNEATSFNSSKEGLEFLNAGLVRDGNLGQYTHFDAFQGSGDTIARNVALIEEN